MAEGIENDKQRVIQTSLQRWTRSRAEVEAALIDFLDLGSNASFHFDTAVELGRTAIHTLIDLAEESHLSTHQTRSVRRAVFLVAKLSTVAQGFGRFDANTVIDG